MVPRVVQELLPELVQELEPELILALAAHGTKSLPLTTPSPSLHYTTTLTTPSPSLHQLLHQLLPLQLLHYTNYERHSNPKIISPIFLENISPNIHKLGQKYPTLVPLTTSPRNAPNFTDVPLIQLKPRLLKQSRS